MSKNPPVLELNSISKSFNQGKAHLKILQDASLKIKYGESVSLVGPSGCGKSTLLHIAGLLEKPDAGEIIIDGSSASSAGEKIRTSIRREKIGFIYQYHHLLSEFSALENVMIPQMIDGKSKKSACSKATKLLKKLGLGKRIQHRPSELSGGEQQRVAIARALANDPMIILADEPTGNLDPHTSKEVFDMLIGLVSEDSLSLFLVTHNMELAGKCSRKLSLKDGKIKTS